MHIVAAIIGFIIMAFFWWRRLSEAGRAASEVANKVGIVRGNIRRKGLRKKAEMSPITAIDNPLIAAATLLFSTQSEEFVLGEGDEEVIEKLLLNLANEENVNEAMIYARWAITQIDDPKMVIDKLGVLLKSELRDNEKRQLMDLLKQANTEIGGCYNFSATSVRLAKKMGLEITR